MTPPQIWGSRNAIVVGCFRVMSSTGEEQQVGDSREARNVGVYTHSLLLGPAVSSDDPPGTVFTVEKSEQMAECSAGLASGCKGLQLRWFWVS